MNCSASVAATPNPSIEGMLKRLRLLCTPEAVSWNSRIAVAWTPINEISASHRNSNMPTLMTRRSVAILIATLVMSLMVASRSKKIEESFPYQEACQGSPLRTVELRNKAMEDG